jgi:hypothetical protein
MQRPPLRVEAEIDPPLIVNARYPSNVFFPDKAFRRRLNSLSFAETSAEGVA